VRRKLPLAVAAAALTVVVWLVFFRPRPAPEGGRDPAPPTTEGGKPAPAVVPATDIVEFFPPPERRDGLDRFTRQSIELMEKLLADRKQARWPSRFVFDEDATDGDRRQVRVHLEKVLRVRVVELSEGASVTLSGEDGSKPVPMRLGPNGPDGKPETYLRATEVRAAFASPATLRRTFMVGGDKNLLDNLNFELDAVSCTIADVPDCPPGEACFRAVIRSGSFRAELTRAGERWKVVRIEPAS
jgi:hypothetical protein